MLLLLLSPLSHARLCDPIDGSPPGSAVPGILQARPLEWVAISFSNEWKWKVQGKSPSRVWLRDPMYCSLPGPSVHGVFQARVLEWGAIAFSASAGYTGLTPGPGSKIPHAVGQLRPRATTTEPAYSRARALQQEKPPQREACTAQLNSGPRSQQLEKSPWAATKTQRSQK